MSEEQSDYVKAINDAKLEEIFKLQQSSFFYSEEEPTFDLQKLGLDQLSVGERLNINGKKACLVSTWMINYVLEGASVEQVYSVMEKEVSAGRITEGTSYMKDQLATSENLAKSLKRDSFDNKFIQSPWKNNKQVVFKSLEEFKKSDYKYSFVKYKSVQSKEFHYTLLVNLNGQLTEYDPYPGGINSLTTWDSADVTIESIEPKGWYFR